MGPANQQVSRDHSARPRRAPRSRSGQERALGTRSCPPRRERGRMGTGELNWTLGRKRDCDASRSWTTLVTPRASSGRRRQASADIGKVLPPPFHRLSTEVPCPLFQNLRIIHPWVAGSPAGGPTIADSTLTTRRWNPPGCAIARRFNYLPWTASPISGWRASMLPRHRERRTLHRRACWCASTGRRRPVWTLGRDPGSWNSQCPPPPAPKAT